MKPIRSNELEFFKDMIREKFYDKKETLRTQITSDAQKLSDKKQPFMAKQCGVEAELKKLKQLMRNIESSNKQSNFKNKNYLKQLRKWVEL